MVTAAREVQPLNASEPITVTLSLMTMVLILVHPFSALDGIFEDKRISLRPWQHCDILKQLYLIKSSGLVG